MVVGYYVDDSKPLRVARFNDLHTYAVVLLERRPQGLVALLQRIQRGSKRVDLERPAYVHRERLNIPRRTEVELVQEPQAALGK